MTFRSLSCIFPCRNITQTAAWYEEKLGFVRKDHLHLSEPHICLYKDGTEVILLKTGQEVIPNRILYGYGYDVYFYVADQDSLYEEYLQKGVKIVKELRLSDYDNRQFVIEDPEGRHLAFGLKQIRSIQRVSHDDPVFLQFCQLLEEDHIRIVKEQRHPKGNCLSGLERFTDIYILYLNDLPAGSIALGRIDDNTGEVCRVYVKEEFRQHGIAKQLLQKVEERAKEYGMKRLVLDTYDRFAEAVNLYHACGYSDMNYTDPESPYSKYMEKQIG